MGQFVDAEIEGELLKNVYKIPRAAIRENSHILIIDAENRLNRRVIDILWSDPHHVVVDGGIEPGELLCVTPLAHVADLTKVQPRIDNENTLSATGGNEGNTSTREISNE